MIKKETIIRLLVLLIVLINQVLVSTGVLSVEFEENQIYELVSTIVTIVVAMWTAWKNNSITKNAIKADEYLKNLNGK